MKTIKEIKTVLKQHKSELQDRFSVKEIGVFGSYVKNGQRNRSDLDILVEFTVVPGFFQFIELENHLGKILGIKIDLVMKSALKPVIGRHILNEVVYV